MIYNINKYRFIIQDLLHIITGYMYIFFSDDKMIH